MLDFDEQRTCTIYPFGDENSRFQLIWHFINVVRGFDIIDFSDRAPGDGDLQLAVDDAGNGMHRNLEIVVLAFASDKQEVGIRLANNAEKLAIESDHGCADGNLAVFSRFTGHNAPPFLN